MDKNSGNEIPASPQISLRPDIFAYHDYRKFLRDWSEYQKSSGTRGSLRSLAKEVGLSPAYLPMVLSGKRKMSDDVLDRLLVHLGLELREKSYLRLLCKIDQSKTFEQSSKIYQKVQRFQTYQDRNPNEAEFFRYISNWLNVVIREMVTLPDFRWDAKWIHEQIAYPVAFRDVARALEFLENHGFVEVGQDGTCKIGQKEVACIGSIYRVALANYHNQMFGKVSEAIDRFPSDKRNVTGITMPLSPEGAEKMKAILERTMEELRALAASDGSPHAIYHIGLMGIPMTEPASELDENADTDEGDR